MKHGKTAVLLTASKNFDVGMHSDVCEWMNRFGSNFCVKIDTIKLYIMILIVTLNLIQGHREKNKTFRGHYLTVFILDHSIHKEENLTFLISLKKCNP